MFISDVIYTRGTLSPPWIVVFLFPIKCKFTNPRCPLGFSPLSSSFEQKSGGPFAQPERDSGVSSSVGYRAAFSRRGIGHGREANSRSSERRSSFPGGEPKRGSAQITPPSFREGNCSKRGRGSSDDSARMGHIDRSRDISAKDKTLPAVNSRERGKGGTERRRVTLQEVQIRPRGEGANAEAGMIRLLYLLMTVQLCSPINSQRRCWFSATK